MNQQALDTIKTLASKYGGIVNENPTKGEVDVNAVDWVDTCVGKLPRTQSLADEIAGTLAKLSGNYIIKTHPSVNRVTIVFPEEALVD